MAKPRKTEEAEVQKARTHLQALQDKTRAMQREMAKTRKKIATAERRDDLHRKAVKGGYFDRTQRGKTQEEMLRAMEAILATLDEGDRERFRSLESAWIEKQLERQQKAAGVSSASPSGLRSQLPAGSPPQS